LTISPEHLERQCLQHTATKVKSASELPLSALLEAASEGGARYLKQLAAIKENFVHVSGVHGTSL
jgi:hypothetical protein